jgi:hypothetical protein
MHFRHPLPLVLCAILVLISTFSCLAQEPAQKPDEPRITGVRFFTFPPPAADDKVSFRLAIDGENLPKPASRDDVRFTTKDPVLSVEVISIVAANKKEVLVEATAKVGTEITGVTVAQGDTTVVTSRDFTVSIKGNPPAQKLKQFAIKFDHEKNKEFPNLHSLLVTKEGGEGGFAENPNRMRVDLMPTGATDVDIVQSNDQQLDLHFVAAADYEPKSVVVTVYDGSDLDKRQATAVAKTPAEDPNQPKITGTDIVFIDRSQGVGRIRIYGKGFGDYPSPPYPVDEYLWNCLEEFHIRGTVRTDGKDDWVRNEELQDVDARIKACAKLLKGRVDETITVEELKKRLEETKTNLATYVTKEPKLWEEWGEEIRKKVTVGVNSRNSDIAVERVEILNINDKMIDVYFEFTRHRGFAWPFRLADASVTLKKMVAKTTQTVKNEKVTGTVIGVQETFTVPYQPGPKRDPNLTYRYTVLSRRSANTLLGKGIADRFYVLQLSVVNNGDKKVTIPLSAIQAEVEWVRGDNRKTKEKPPTVSYLAGPPTLPPIPLAAVSGYFDAYQKVKGARAILFNVLDATTMAATALVPFTGPSFKDAEVFFSGGFVPAMRKGFGDLSGQQLENLTSLSWESSETLPAKGGSIEKLIYIQKDEQFNSKRVDVYGVPPITRKQIANIMDLEITGFEVIESEAKQATQTTSSQAPPQSAAPTTPAAPTPAGTAPNDK